MKKAYNTSQQEIRSIERQTASMQKELEICSSMFMNADHNYKSKFVWRVIHVQIVNFSNFLSQSERKDQQVDD